MHSRCTRFATFVRPPEGEKPFNVAFESDRLEKQDRRLWRAWKGRGAQRDVTWPPRMAVAGPRCLYQRDLRERGWALSADGEVVKDAYGRAQQPVAAVGQDVICVNRRLLIRVSWPAGFGA